jgi:hypothetical protein
MLALADLLGGLSDKPYQRSSSNTVDEEPRDEGCQEEPGLEEPGHEGGHVRAETNAVLEESIGVVWKEVLVNKNIFIGRLSVSSEDFQCRKTYR